MRILHTESSLNWGGQEYRIIEQMEWLNNNGHESYLAAPFGSEILKKAKEKGLSVIETPFSSTFDIISILRMRSFIRRHKIDIIDSHGNKDADGAGFCQDMCGIIRSFHVYKTIKPTFIRKLRWRFLNHRVIATAACIQKQIANLGFKSLEKIEVVGEWADTPFFIQKDNRLKNKEYLCKKYNLSETVPLYGIIGMLRKDKGQMTFLKIAEEYEKKGLEGNFLIIGEAPKNQRKYEEELLEFIENKNLRKRVHFLGYISDIPELMSALDAVLLCSHNVEAQSRIVPQAFAVGVPIIASKVGGVPELITNKENGILVEIGDVEGYFSALQALRKFPAETERMIESARKFASSTLTLSRRMQETLEIYKKLKMFKGRS